MIYIQLFDEIQREQTELYLNFINSLISSRQWSRNSVLILQLMMNIQILALLTVSAMRTSWNLKVLQVMNLRQCQMNDYSG